MPLYSNVGLISENFEDMATESTKKISAHHCDLRPSPRNSHEYPHEQHHRKAESVGYIFAADSVVLPCFCSDLCGELTKMCIPECVVTIEGHQKSMISVSIEIAYTTSY